MKNHYWLDKGIHVIMLNEDETIELDNETVERIGLTNALFGKVKENIQHYDSRGRLTPRPTNVIIMARGKARFDDIVDLILVVQGTGARVVAFDIPSFINSAMRCA